MEKNYLQMSFRLPDLGGLCGLCQVRSAGHYIVHSGFRGIPMHKDFLEVFWGVSGSGAIKYGDKTINLKAGETFCYFPGDFHDVMATDSRWEFFWVTFDGPHLEELIRIFGLSHTPRQSGQCPIRLFEDLIVYLLKIDYESMILASSRGYEILTRLVTPQVEHANNSRVVAQFQKIVEREYGNAAFSIERAANEIGIHRSSLHRILITESGVSPQDYLLSFRLHRACNLLPSDMTIKAISTLCGFSSTNYFTRVFRKRIGKTPASFRNHVSIQSP